MFFEINKAPSPRLQFFQNAQLSEIAVEQFERGEGWGGGVTTHSASNSTSLTLTFSFYHPTHPSNLLKHIIQILKNFTVLDSQDS